jgi:hypothetical protein
MMRTCLLTLSIVALAPLAALAQAPAALAPDRIGYRKYVLGQSVAEVAGLAGLRLVDARTIHERPARIQELEWRAPFGHPATEQADPVRDIVFTFCDDQLFRVAVNYHPDRTEGLTDGDIIGSLAVTYDLPARGRPTAAQRAATDAVSDTVVVASWDTPDAWLTLLRNVHRREFQLVLTSKSLGVAARAAALEAMRLDTIEAPQREREQRRADAAGEVAAKERTRTTNRAAFKP